MAQKEPAWRVLRYLGYLTQFGLSVVTPILLCVLLAVYFCDRYGIGEWLIALGLGVGLISAGCGFFRFARLFLAINADKPDASRRGDDTGEN